MSDHPRGRVAGWVLIALAGLAIAVLLSVAASSLSTQPIGLAGEQLRGGERLAPPAAPAARPAPRPQGRPATPDQSRPSTSTATTPFPTSPTQAQHPGDAGDDQNGRHTDNDDD